jgi:hypothetical protein
MSVRFKALVLVSDRTRGIRRCSSSFVTTNQTELINLVVFSVGKRRPPLIANWIKRSNFAAALARQGGQSAAQTSAVK